MQTHTDSFDPLGPDHERPPERIRWSGQPASVEAAPLVVDGGGPAGQDIGPPPVAPTPSPVPGGGVPAVLHQGRDLIERHVEQWRSGDVPPWLGVVVLLTAGLFMAAAGVGVTVVALRPLTSDSVLLVAEARDGGTWHLLGDGDEPEFENRVALPYSFEPADRLDGDETTPGVTDDGDHVIGTAYDGSSGAVLGVELDDGEVIELLDTAGRADVLLDEDRILAVDDGSSTDRCYRLEVDGDPVELGAGDSCAFDPSGRFLAVVDRGQVDVLDVDDGDLRFTVPGTDISFAPDGRHLAVSDDTGTAIVDTGSGDEVLRGITGAGVGSGRWNDGSALLLLDSGSQVLELLEVAGGIITAEGVTDAHFVSGNGSDLVIESSDGSVGHLAASSGTVTPVLDDADVVDLRDGADQVVGSLVHDDVNLGRIVDGSLETVLRLPDGTVDVTAVESADGLLILTQTSDGTATLHLIDGGEASVLLDQRAVGGSLFPERGVVTLMLQDEDGAFLYVVDGGEVFALDRADALSGLVWVDGTAHYSRIDDETARVMKVSDLSERPEAVIDGYVVVTGR